jgi:hypothetical protein
VFEGPCFWKTQIQPKILKYQEIVVDGMYFHPHPSQLPPSPICTPSENNDFLENRFFSQKILWDAMPHSTAEVD